MEENNQSLTQSPAQGSSSEQTPIVTPANSIDNKSKLKLPILIIGVIIFLLIAGAASAAFIFLPKSNIKPPKQSISEISPQITAATNTPDATANWITFNNEKISLKYPPNWFVNKFSESEDFELSDMNDSVNKIQGGSDTYTRVGVFYAEGPIPSVYPLYSNGSEGNPTVKPFTINGYQGIRGQMTSTAGLIEFVELNDPKNNVHVQLELTPPIKNEDQATIPQDSKKLFDQILSTFRFII